MRVMVTGSRDYTYLLSLPIIQTLIAIDTKFPKPHTLIHGDAAGADIIAAAVAKCLDWIVIPYPANWRPNGVFDISAGHKRNQTMVDTKPDLVIAFPLPGSRGTWDAVTRARRAGLPVEVIQ